MTIQVALTINDKDLELGIQQALIDAKQQGTPPDVFLAQTALTAFQQFRGANKRAAVQAITDLVTLVNGADDAQVAALNDVLAYAQQHLTPK